MFENLVESGSHKEDLARKSSFFLGTLGVYAVLLLAVFVAGIYLYDAQLENDNLELFALVAPVPVEVQPEPEQPKEQPKPQTQPERQVATRTELIARADEPTKVPDKPATVASRIPPRPPGGAVIGRSNTDPVGNVGPVTVGTGSGAPTGPVVKVEDDDPPPPPAPKPPPKKTIVSGGVLNGKAISKPAPPYPPIAKAARAAGTVTVQIVVDETGRVISASAVSGHPLLRAAAEAAARQAKFSPTQLSGQPVKVSGVITYNFQLQ